MSRPKTVMNHGIPAAGSIPMLPSVRIRSAARSATDWAKRARETVVRGAEAWHLQAPGVERGLHVRPALAEAPLDDERQRLLTA